MLVKSAIEIVSDPVEAGFYSLLFLAAKKGWGG